MTTSFQILSNSLFIIQCCRLRAEQKLVTGFCQHSHSWFWVLSGLMTIFLYISRLLLCFKMGPLLQQEKASSSANCLELPTLYSADIGSIMKQSCVHAQCTHAHKWQRLSTWLPLQLTVSLARGKAREKLGFRENDIWEVCLSLSPPGWGLVARLTT
jgi:hypothetical protein